MNILLCGMPCSGKTTVGKLLADQIGSDFADLDQMISAAQHLTCKEIVLKEGEKYFRQVEKEQVLNLMDVKNTVIALGGGVLCDQDNVQRIKQIGCLVYIQTPIEILWERVKKRGLLSYLDPDDPEKSFYSVAKNRVNSYVYAADKIIDANGWNEKQIVEEIISLIIEPFPL